MSESIENAPLERLRRLLLLVPYVSKNQGVSVSEAAKAMGVDREGFLKDLDLLSMVGRPPFQPDDFVDIYVEDDKVFVELDARFKAPPRFTTQEVVALLAAAKWAQSDGDTQLENATSKLKKSLPAQALSAFEEMSKKLDTRASLPMHFAVISEAIANSRVISFEYLTQSRETSETRDVEPHELRHIRGQWYLSGFCRARQDERLFRVDYISKAAMKSENFTPPAQQPRHSDNPAVAARTFATVQFQPRAAPFVLERFRDGVEKNADGTLTAKVPADSKRWLLGWVMSFGGDAQILSPKWAVEAISKTTRELSRREA